MSGHPIHMCKQNPANDQVRICNESRNQPVFIRLARWRGKLRALYLRHEELALEMERRGYHHASALDVSLGTGSSTQDEYVDTPQEQRAILRAKGCDCQV